MRRNRRLAPQLRGSAAVDRQAFGSVADKAGCRTRAPGGGAGGDIGIPSIDTVLFLQQVRKKIDLSTDQSGSLRSAVTMSPPIGFTLRRGRKSRGD